VPLVAHNLLPGGSGGGGGGGGGQGGTRSSSKNTIALHKRAREHTKMGWVSWVSQNAKRKKRPAAKHQRTDDTPLKHVTCQRSPLDYNSA
jgi:hypothetical protein